MTEQQPLLSPLPLPVPVVSQQPVDEEATSTHTNGPTIISSSRRVRFEPAFSSEQQQQQHTNNNNQRKSLLLFPVDLTKSSDAFRFGVRVAILVGFSSLFATNSIPILGQEGIHIEWPQGMWVTVSSLMVCWFPKLDAASVVQKSLQRLGGTLLGGFLALICGIMSRWILPKYVYRRAIFLHLSYALICFGVTYLSMRIRLDRTSSIMNKYNYGTVLCLLTFTITLFPFLKQEDPWKKAVWRIINVAMGVFIAAVGSMLILPRSTTDMLLQRIQKQCQLAGESSEAVLHAAADVLCKESIADVPKTELTTTTPVVVSRMDSQASEQSTESWLGIHMWDSIRVSVLRTSFSRVHRDILLHDPTTTTLDVVLEKYESAIQDWKDTKSLFSLFWFDPFHYLVPMSPQFHEGCATILSRALRVQTTVVLLDGIVRNDPQHLSCLDTDLHALLTEMGTLLRKMLVVPRQQHATRDSPSTMTMSTSGILHSNNNDMMSGSDDNASIMTTTSTANDFFKEKLLDRLGSFRHSVNQMATKMQGESKTKPGSRHYALMFLQLVEHLTHRSISLYESWVVMEELLDNQTP
ncbi:expressed unknown protein [Seminavis robusta]|uniref:Uncharacterized protein n=1 Tax=Seminavis robusta TaxID=568900 RepID=A0A9N8HCN3_9STRA|nr:expressed unknown protein [Seminavis robusta]|eukprot:Sro419_g139120.1 n/a (580) ;mRNA; f:41254-42993